MAGVRTSASPRLAGCLALSLGLTSTGAWTAPVDAGERQCLDAFRLQTARIEREFAARRSAQAAEGKPADARAEQRSLHAALTRAADAEQACTKAARQVSPSRAGMPPEAGR
ncbi:hypothetical protein [Inhella sp.]|uniref:hypothetical protein n=1 Tax=Inhella sp. TaxID=1921806 RepID=UPI0035B1A0B5